MRLSSRKSGARRDLLPYTQLYDENSPPPSLVVGPSGRIYSGSSTLFHLKPHQEPRRRAISLVESRWFDPCILLSILANCVTMAWQSPLDPCCTDKARFLAWCEDAFLAVFTGELLLKVLAYGFVSSKSSYLRDPWCQLDFVIVSLGWLPILFPSLGNYSGLRAFRALRPLRALKRLPGMPLLVQWIIDVLPKLGDVLMLSTFMFLMFGIVGMELFKGSLHHRCALPGYTETVDPTTGRSALSADEQRPFDTGVSCRMHPKATNSSGGAEPFGACARVDQLGATAAASGATCAYFVSNPDGGVTSFDSIGYVMVSLVKAMTFDHWANEMYELVVASSQWAWVYFVLVVIFAGFFVANLFLAVVFLAFETSQVSLLALDEPTAHPTANTASEDAASAADANAAVPPREAESANGAASASGAASVSGAASASGAGSVDDATACQKSAGTTTATATGTAAAAAEIFSSNEAAVSRAPDLGGGSWSLPPSMVCPDDRAMAAAPQWLMHPRLTANEAAFAVNGSAALKTAQTVQAAKAPPAAAARTPSPSQRPAAATADDDRFVPAPTNSGHARPSRSVTLGVTVDRDGVTLGGDDALEPAGGGCCPRLMPIATSTWLARLSTALVLLNMVLMCMPYEGMSDVYDQTLERGAEAISYLFMLEMAIKLGGLGCHGYWSDRWNCLDGTLVCLSIVDVAAELVLYELGELGGDVNLSYLRVLRLLRMLRVLRILRLMRTWKGLYVIISTFLRVLPQVAGPLRHPLRHPLQCTTVGAPLAPRRSLSRARSHHHPRRPPPASHPTHAW